MNKSVSQRAITNHSPNFSKSPSRRTIYLNQQTCKREVSTSFHSPYKNGRPNPQYHNPSYISSHLFYPKEYVEPNSQFNVTKNYIPNHNDIQKETQYRQRLRHDQHSRPKNNDKYNKRQRQHQNQRHNNQTRIFRINEPETLLRNELDNLHNYRQGVQCKQERVQQLSRRRELQPSTPTYLQRSRRPQGRENKVGAEEWAELARELGHLKRELKLNNIEAETRTMDRVIERNLQINREQQYQQRRQGQLLGNILREQIRTNELKRGRQWQP